MMHSRRDLLAAAAGTVFASILLPLRAAAIPHAAIAPKSVRAFQNESQRRQLVDQSHSAFALSIEVKSLDRRGDVVGPKMRR
jgi:hypothetical protein